MYRRALAALGQDSRKMALDGLHEKLAAIERDAIQIHSKFGKAGLIKPDPDFALSFTTSFSERVKKLNFYETTVIDAKNGAQNRLLTAEMLARDIWLSIHYEENRGVYSETGLLEGLRHAFRDAKIRGGQDKDTLRKNWLEYRGVAHLGAAVIICRQLQITGRDVVLFAEEIRFALSNERPKGQKKAYVPEEEQISFRLNSEF